MRFMGFEVWCFRLQCWVYPIVEALRMYRSASLLMQALPAHLATRPFIKHLVTQALTMIHTPGKCVIPALCVL